MPGRILDRQVGGNTTYARQLAAGLRATGIEVTSIRHSTKAPVNAIWESLAGYSVGTYDIVHYVADTGPILRTRVPSVLTVHGVASRWISVARTKNQERVWRGRVSMALRNVDSVVTVSQSSADDIAEVFDYPREKLSVIHHGIDPSYFNPIDETSLGSQLPASSPYVLYVGNIEPRKNLESLVTAMEAPAVRALGLRLVIAGRPAWNFERTMEAMATSPHVTYLGFVSEEQKRNLIRNAELFCFPSYYEGFGFPVLEALAAGAVVCSTRSGSLKEVAGPSLEIEGHDPQAVADALVVGVTDTGVRHRCRTEGPGWARKFSWDESVEKHLNIYGRVLP
ncbi:glycosyltransferase family 4 protein [Terrabacter sp. RAF57]|uniref:glycosyltransferase family 4 protein n=1 Tax=Terrabacter sp. RAF57 TaxID=3233063 RepID=UPI003F98FA1E